MSGYDKYYKTEDYFGDPYPELIDFFERYEPKGRLLDLGCGQGRNAIPLARLGYNVTGIDLSKVGINRIVEAGAAEDLNLQGIVDDLYDFDNFDEYDIILLDSMFHFEKPDKKREIALIEKIASGIKTNGSICFCIQDLGDKINVLKETLSDSQDEFNIIKDSKIKYLFEDKESSRKSVSDYRIYVIKKI